jgi:hypothetical protein
MPTNSSDEPQPRDIALEEATPEQVEQLEEQSDPVEENENDSP